MSRGDRRENLYLDDVDRQEFIKTLAEACLKTGWQNHAFCLMGNHFHLVVETQSASLSAGMHWLLSSYTIRFNHRHKLSGHVFSGKRGRKILVEELKRRKWTEGDLKKRRKSDPEKLAMAARIHKETTLPMRTIAQLVGLGTTNAANANLQAWKK